jgi:mRNA-degrading endonuclease toxin of MazEF toxin-antitoxin module
VTITPKRGHVYRMNDPEYGTLYCLAVSVMGAYEDDDSILAVRVTVTSQAHRFPGWVRMSSGDPCTGYVVTHDLDRVDIDELATDCGPLSVETMLDVEKALRRMLGI